MAAKNCWPWYIRCLKTWWSSVLKATFIQSDEPMQIVFRLFFNFTQLKVVSPKTELLYYIKIALKLMETFLVLIFL